MQILTGHSRSIREASWSPDGQFVVRPVPRSIDTRAVRLMLMACPQTTSSVDGMIRVWQLDAGTEPTCVHVIDGLIPAEDAECVQSIACSMVSPLIRLLWSQLRVLGRGHLAPRGQVLRRGKQGQRCVSGFFAVRAVSDRCTCRHRRRLARDLAEDRHLLVQGRRRGAPLPLLCFSPRLGTRALTSDVEFQRVSSLAFSANGLYLASSSLSGDLLVWSVKDRSVVSRTPHTHGLITSLAFHPAPTANSLAYIDNKGRLTRWQGAVPANLPAPTHARAAPPAKEAPAKSAGAAQGRKRSDSASTSTSSHAGDKGALFRKDQASDDEYGDLDLGDDGWLDDDLGDRLNGELGAAAGDADEDGDPFADDVPMPGYANARDGPAGFSRGRSVPTAGRTMGVRRGQAPFQPGATPWREKRRYLGAPACFSFPLGLLSSTDAAARFNQPST